MYGGEKKWLRVLVWKPEFQKPFKRSKRRCSDIRMDLGKQAWRSWTGMMRFGRGTRACLTFWGRCGDQGHVLHSGGDAGIEGMSYILGEMRGSRACHTFWGRCGDRGHVLHSGGDAGIEGTCYSDVGDL